MAETLLEQATRLAKLSRGEVVNPFSRKLNGKFDIKDRNAREGTLRAIHDCYEGRFGNYADPQPQAVKQPNKYLDQPGRISLNVLRLFVDILAVSYDEAPTRIYYRNGVRVDQDDSEDGKLVAALNARLQDADYDRFMGMLDRYMRLFGNVVARPIWDSANQTLVFHAYPGYCVRVIENKLNPRAPEVTILLGSRTELSEDGKDVDINTAEIWMGDRMIEVDVTDDKAGTTTTLTHDFSDSTIAYDFNPLVHCFDNPPFGGAGMYFVDAPGWQLAQQNVRINEDYISQYIYAVLMQAIGILVAKGEVGELVIGPGSAVHFPVADDGSGLESVAQNADLSAFRDAIEFVFDLMRETYGIPRGVFQAEVMSSGAAVIQANAPLAEMRQARQPIFSIIENKLLRSALQELRGRADEFPMTLNPSEWSVSLQYADVRANVSVQDEIAKDQHLLSIGVLTPAEILMREKPGQFDTIGDAEKWIDANKPEEPAAPGEEDTPPDDGEQTGTEDQTSEPDLETQGQES